MHTCSELGSRSMKSRRSSVRVDDKHLSVHFFADSEWLPVGLSHAHHQFPKIHLSVFTTPKSIPQCTGVRNIFQLMFTKLNSIQVSWTSFLIMNKIPAIYFHLLLPQPCTGALVSSSTYDHATLIFVCLLSGSPIENTTHWDSLCSTGVDQYLVKHQHTPAIWIKEWLFGK